MKVRFRYRDASADVFRVLNANYKLVEKASIDEAYLDLTEDVQRLKETKPTFTVEDFPTTHLAGSTTKSEDERKERLNVWLKDQSSEDERNYDLVLGGYLVEQIRKKIKEETGFFCSAGVARNKVKPRRTEQKTFDWRTCFDADFSKIVLRIQQTEKTNDLHARRYR